MVVFIAPTFKYPTMTSGSWNLLFGADNTSPSADTGGGTYASSGYLQLDATKWALGVSAVASGSPATGKVKYTIGVHSYSVGDTVAISGVLTGSPSTTSNGYNGVFTITDVGSASTTAGWVAVTNATTATVVGLTNAKAGFSWAPTGNLLNKVPGKDILSIDVHRGRAREDQSCDVGTMTVVLDNTSGNYDPDNTNGVWQFPVLSGGSLTTASSLARGMWGQLLWYDGSKNNYAFTGVLESVETDQDIFPTVTMTFVDVLAQIGQASIPAGGLTGAAGETSKARIYNVLAAAGVLQPTVQYQAGAYVYSYPQVSLGTLNRTHAAVDLSGSPLEAIESIAVSEGGRVFCNVSGALRVLSHADLPTSASAADYTLTDAGSGGFEYTSIVTLPMHKQLVNQANVVLPTGQSVTAVNQSSVKRYGLAAVEVQSTLSNDAGTTPASTAAAFAAFLANRRAAPSTAFSAVRFELRGLATADIAAVVGGELGDKVTVTRTTRPGLTITAGCLIEGIDVSLTPDSWTWTVTTSSIDGYTY